MRNRILLALVLGIALLLLVLNQRGSLAHRELLTEKSSVLRQKSPRFKESATELRDSQAPVAEKSAPAQSAARFNSFSDRAEEFRHSYGDLDMVGKRERLIAQLATDREQVERATEITADLELAEKIFGDRQSEARVLAMRVLIENARLDGPERIESLAKKVAEEVSRNPKATKGRGVDLTDLVEGWIRAVGAEKVVEHPQLFRDRMVIREALLVPYLRALNYVYGERFNDPQFSVRKAFEEGLANET
jgi:hypothetical protein